MLGKTLELPQQILSGMELGSDFIRAHKLKKLDALDWFGLGGSAVAGDLLQGLGLEPPALPLRITVHRYPRASSEMRMVCSYSGNTVESVHAFEDVSPSQVWLAMSNGGRLQELAYNAGVPHLKLPGGYLPRAAVGFSLGAMIAILDSVFDLRITDACGAACQKLIATAKEYRILDVAQNPALVLASKLADRTSIVYVVDGLSMPAQAIRFRAQLAENAKVWSHSAPLPELAHNEVESFEFLGQLLPPPLVIFLGSWQFAGKFADPRVGLKSILDSLGIQHITLDPVERWGKGLSRLEVGLRTMLFLDSVSVYLALLRAVDPSEIPTITRLKNYRPAS